MDREQVRLGMWLLNNNPNLANDLGVSLRAARSNDNSGSYNPMSRIMTLFKERGQETLIAHEILHHAERMMPEDIQAGIRAEWVMASGQCSSVSALTLLLTRRRD